MLIPRPDRLALLILTGVLAAGCWTDEDPATPDATVDSKVSPEADTGLTVDGYTTVDQPAPPLVIACSPQQAPFDSQVCAAASVTVDRSADPPTCTVQSGEDRSGEPVLTVEQQDEDCAGGPVIEVIYFARVNAAWRFVSTTHGIKSTDDAIREIPGAQLVQVILETTSTPKVEIAVSFRIVDQLEITKVEERR